MTESRPAHAAVMDRTGAERGWPSTWPARHAAGASPAGALLVGTPGEVMAKILARHALIGHRRHLVQLSVRTMPHEPTAPIVREEVARREAASVSPWVAEATV